MIERFIYISQHRMTIEQKVLWGLFFGLGSGLVFGLLAACVCLSCHP